MAGINQINSWASFLTRALCFSVLLILISCGKKEADKPVRPQVDEASDSRTFPKGAATSIKLHSFTEVQREVLQSDLEILAGLPKRSGDQNIFNVSEFSGAGFNTWIGERVKHVLARGFRFTSNLRPEGPETLFRGRTFAQLLDGYDYSEIWASNIGAGIIMAQSRHKTTYSMRLGDEWARVRSPRHGVIFLGDLFFQTHIRGSKIDQIGNRAQRMVTVVHEARHSDGRGTHLGFPHGDCEDSYDYPVCDAFTNGANGVEVQFLRYLLSDCWGCKREDRQALAFVLAEARSRIRSDATFKDPTPEEPAL